MNKQPKVKPQPQIEDLEDLNDKELHQLIDDIESEHDGKVDEYMKLTELRDLK